MSHLFLATDADILASRLLDEIALRQKIADPFEPISIVVPNRFVQQWLKFKIAREWGVAINLRFSFLEHALWDWLRELDPRPHERPPELLDADRYSLLVLSILWNDTDPALEPLQTFFEKGAASRLGCRRAWQIAELLGGLVRDYEYHRQESIIQHWLRAEAVDVPAAWREREAAQRAVFRAVVDETAGRRAILNRELKRNFKTLPQYVMEFIHEVKDYRAPAPRLIHLFGLSQISPLHVRALELLGQFHDWRIYHLNPLASRIQSSRQAARAAASPREGTAPARSADGTRSVPATLAAFRGEERPDNLPGTELLHIWGRAGVESLGLTADFLRDPRFRRSLLRAPAEPLHSNTVLNRLQDMLFGASNLPQNRLPQDASLQIVRCPGIWREAETIHAAIVHTLHQNPNLQQTDIAVLVTDMELYRPVLTAVFERPPRRLSFGLADYTAARVSTFGQAVLGMLDLALENLSRSRVFDVLLNPCVLARLKIERDSALHWLTWAEKIGIHHGWDATEKKDQGYQASPLYSWKLGLQRLRLGQYMTVVPDDAQAEPPQWQGVIPFGDVESGDRERLDQFCRIVEGMLPMLVRLRGMMASGAAWAEAILALMQRFLAVPDDRPEEEPVRDALIESLGRLGEWDALPGGRSAPLPLALVREFVVSHLQDIPGRRNDFLSSGITIAALQPQRPIPFEIIFLAGMGEAHFPGGGALAPFDLRQIKRQPGDILPVEQQRFAFLEAILSARQKLVITYNARDLQKDENLEPGVPVTQLERFVATHIVSDSEFRSVTVPLVGHDPDYLDANARLPFQDCLVQDNRTERILTLDAALRSGRLALAPDQHAELAHQRERVSPSFFAAMASRETRPTPTVGLVKLRKFLENPASAALRYHLRADDEWDEGREDDFEPLTSPQYVGKRLVTQTLQQIVLRAEAESVAELASGWPAEFARKYQEWTQRGHLPEGAFGAVDAEVLKAQVEAGLNEGGVFAFLERQSVKPWCGPYAFGESDTPQGARRRAPALVLPLSRPLPEYPDGQVRIVGAWPYAWRDEASLDLLVFHPGKAEPKKPLGRGLLEPLLFAVALAALGEIGGRAVILHLARPDEITAVPLDGALLSEDAARAYLCELATDFLDGRCADQLPFEILQKDLSKLYQDEDGDRLDAVLLENWREREQEEDWGFQAKPAELTRLGFRVPDDAGIKLRHRFRPLYLLLPAPEEKPRRKKNGDGA